MDSDFAAGEDTAFVNDEISSIIKEAIGKGSYKNIMFLSVSVLN